MGKVISESMIESGGWNWVRVNVDGVYWLVWFCGCGDDWICGGGRWWIVVIDDFGRGDCEE